MPDAVDMEKFGATWSPTSPPQRNFGRQGEPPTVRASGPAERNAARQAERRLVVYLDEVQRYWLRGVEADALRDDVRLSASAIVRLAIDELRARGIGWQGLDDRLPEMEKSGTTWSPSSPPQRNAARQGEPPPTVRASGPAERNAARQAERRVVVYLEEPQRRWLRGIEADALQDGVRLSASAIIRLAIDELRARGVEWRDLAARPDG